MKNGKYQLLKMARSCFILILMKKIKEPGFSFQSLHWANNNLEMFLKHNEVKLYEIYLFVLININQSILKHLISYFLKCAHKFAFQEVRNIIFTNVSFTNY